LKLLLTHGADVEWSPSNVEGGRRGVNDNVGRTPLMVAMKGGRGVPLSAGPGFARAGDPPFREPSNRAPSAAVRTLLDAGANPNASAPNGAAVLHQAVDTRDLETLQALLEHGAALDARNADGLTALQVAEALKPDDPAASPFGPQRKKGAAPEEIVALLRAAAQGGETQAPAEVRSGR
jgi:ankyrin repeat protein